MAVVMICFRRHVYLLSAVGSCLDLGVAAKEHKEGDSLSILTQLQHVCIYVAVRLNLVCLILFERLAYEVSAGVTVYGV